MSTRAVTPSRAPAPHLAAPHLAAPHLAAPHLAAPGPAAPARAGSAAPALAELIRRTGLTGLVRPASEPAIASSLPDDASGTVPGAAGLGRFLPVLPELRLLLPGGGLRRGTTVAVGRGSAEAPSSGATSLLLALLAAASRAGSWCAVVGLPALGAVAAAELGIDLGRVALVPNPGPEWPTVVAALVDGVDIVVAAPPGPVAATVAGRLAARARQRGSVLVPFGGAWPGADVTLTAVHSEWWGLAEGRGRLRGRQLTIAARGRGAASRPKQSRLWLPAFSGHPAADPVVERPPLTLIPGGGLDEGVPLDEAV